MSDTPTLHTALKILDTGDIQVCHDVPIPFPRDDEVLVRVAYVAVNPVDPKSMDLSPVPGATLGCDFAGEVITVGKAVKRALVPGDRVCSSAFGNNPDQPHNGAFAEYVVTPGDLLLLIPPNISYQSAATLGLGIATVGLALFHTMQLPFGVQKPQANGPYVLIHGGGTATGTLAIQAVRLTGGVPLVTCSPRSSARLMNLGASKTFDYQSPNCGREIHEYTNNQLEYVLDCITDSTSMKICYTALSTKGGQYVGLNPIPVRAHNRRRVQARWIIAFTMGNRPVNWQRPFQRDAKPHHREFGEKWFATVQDWLDSGSIVPHPHEEQPGGLDGISDGIDRVRKGWVSGAKLVYGVS